MEITQFTAKIRHLCRKNKIAIKDMLSACDINRTADVDTQTVDGAAPLAIYNRLSAVDRAKLLLYADGLSRSGGTDGNDGNGSKDGDI